MKVIRNEVAGFFKGQVKDAIVIKVKYHRGRSHAYNLKTAHDECHFWCKITRQKSLRPLMKAVSIRKLLEKVLEAAYAGHFDSNITVVSPRSPIGGFSLWKNSESLALH